MQVNGDKIMVNGLVYDASNIVDVSYENGVVTILFRCGGRLCQKVNGIGDCLERDEQ